MEKRWHWALHWFGQDHSCTFMAELMLKAKSPPPVFFTQWCCLCVAMCLCSLRAISCVSFHASSHNTHNCSREAVDSFSILLKTIAAILGHKSKCRMAALLHANACRRVGELQFILTPVPVLAWGKCIRFCLQSSLPIATKKTFLWFSLKSYFLHECMGTASPFFQFKISSF